MTGSEALQARQVLATATTTTNSYCTPVILPSNGVLVVNASYTVTLTTNAVFEPICTGASTTALHAYNTTLIGSVDPFYASVFPQIFALATATVISYVLVIMLFITPRTFFVGGPGGGVGFLSRRGLIGGSYGNSAVIGVGRRPWLQKVAALSVAASLTIATADTFRVAERQYNIGYLKSEDVVDEVTTSMEIRIIRVISDTFLWLAQVQTLIRLFPRHKEKVVIKWLGFALIMLDTLFSILNNFVYDVAKTRPRQFQDAIPALSYLFELAIGFIYASCVIYFAVSKRRFAFFHPKMRNICLVALMSITAVFIPVVFFVLDVSKPNVAGWGDYIRWVGAAAASVVVWEWVERIESLERDERKDGILGREIFDGDEMIEITPSEEVDYPGQGNDDWGYAKSVDTAPVRRRPLRSRLPFHYKIGSYSSPQPPPPVANLNSQLHPRSTPPPAANTPISRADTASAASTQYAVRYHNFASPSPPPNQQVNRLPTTQESGSSSSSRDSVDSEKGVVVIEAPKNPEPQSHSLLSLRPDLLRGVPNPFKKRKTSPPAEVAGAMRDQRQDTQSPQVVNPEGVKTIFSKIDAFANSQRERFLSHVQGRTIDTTLPVLIIPAQPRGQRTWSPDDFNQTNTPKPTSSEPPSSNPARVPLSSQQPLSSNPTGLPITIIEAPPRRQAMGNSQSPDSQRLNVSTPVNSIPTTPALSSQQASPSFSNENNRIISRRGTLTIAEDRSRTSPLSQHPVGSTFVTFQRPLITPQSGEMPSPLSPLPPRVPPKDKVHLVRARASTLPRSNTGVLSSSNTVLDPGSSNADPGPSSKRTPSAGPTGETGQTSDSSSLEKKNGKANEKEADGVAGTGKEETKLQSPSSSSSSSTSDSSSS